MLLQQTQINVESHGILSEGFFGVDQRNEAHILSILRDKLYPDKIKAIIREYVCNAVDAHAEVGTPLRPVEVFLPTIINPYLRIRDFGPGLSEENIYQVYAKYGASTKRNTNEQIGQLGLGSKSAFCYGNNFTIVSYYNGTCSTYHAYIDETLLGKVSKLSDEKTDQENGVEIVIPAKTSDFKIFAEKASLLFKHFQVRPKVVPEVKITKDEFLPLGNGDSGWRVRESHGWYSTDNNSFAIMGNIAYPIDSKFSENTQIRDFLSSDFEIDFKIGELSVSASRESLEYTEQTKQALLKRISSIIKEIMELYRAKVGVASNIWEARKVYQSLFKTKTLPTFFAFFAKDKEIAYWQGKPIHQSDFSYRQTSKKIVCRYISSSNEVPYSGDKQTTCKYDSNLMIVKVDTAHAWVRRAVLLRAHLVSQGLFNKPPTILALKETADSSEGFTFGEACDKYLELHGLDGIKIHSLSDLPPEVKITTSSKTSFSTAKVKAFLLKSKSFSYNIIKNNWSFDAEIPASGVYLSVLRFKPSKTSISDFNNKISNLSKLEIDISNLNIYGVRESDVAGLSSDWVDFSKWYDQQVSNFMSSPNNKKILQSAVDAAEIKKIYDISTKVIKNICDNESLFKNKESLLLKFCKNYLSFHNDAELKHMKHSVSLESLLGMGGQHNIKPSFPLVEYHNKVKSTFPMLQFTKFFSAYGEHEKTSIKVIIDYINQVGE